MSAPHKQLAAGETVGFMILKQDSRGRWLEVGSGIYGTLASAVSLVSTYSDSDPEGTYAAAKVSLSMISRPS